MITYNVEDVKLPTIKKRETTRWIKKVAATYGRKVGEIGYMFVNDEKILEVNNEYYFRLLRRRYSKWRHCNIARYSTNQCRKVWKNLRRRTLSSHNSRHTPPLWYQR